jgi:hypothetical protein
MELLLLPEMVLLPGAMIMGIPEFGGRSFSTLKSVLSEEAMARPESRLLFVAAIGGREGW